MHKLRTETRNRSSYNPKSDGPSASQAQSVQSDERRPGSYWTAAACEHRGFAGLGRLLLSEITRRWIPPGRGRRIAMALAILERT